MQIQDILLPEVESKCVSFLSIIMSQHTSTLPLKWWPTAGFNLMCHGAGPNDFTGSPQLKTVIGTGIAIAKQCSY